MDISAFFKGLDEVFATGKLEAVKDYLADQLAEAEAEQDNHAALTILNEMVGFLRNTSAPDDAIRAGQKAIALAENLGLADTAAFGTTLLNAATALAATGDADHALQLYQRAQALYKKHLTEGDPLLAGLYNNISGLHREAGDYGQALEYLSQAFAILAGLDNKRNAAAIVQANMAQMLLALGRTEEALAQVQAAIALFEQADLTERSPHYAAALAILAGIHVEQGKEADACRTYEVALAHIKACHGENRSYAITCNNYALALETFGQLARAGHYRARASEVFTRLQAASVSGATVVKPGEAGA